jgi:hypothetical protein
MLVFSAGQGSIVAVKFLQIAVTYHKVTFSNKGLLHSEPKRQKKKRRKENCIMRINQIILHPQTSLSKLCPRLLMNGV